MPRTPTTPVFISSKMCENVFLPAKNNSQLYNLLTNRPICKHIIAHPTWYILAVASICNSYESFCCPRWFSSLTVTLLNIRRRHKTHEAVAAEAPSAALPRQPLLPGMNCAEIVCQTTAAVLNQARWQHVTHTRGLVRCRGCGLWVS
jgi:hypothetical protein